MKTTPIQINSKETGYRWKQGKIYWRNVCCENPHIKARKAGIICTKCGAEYYKYDIKDLLDR